MDDPYLTHLSLFSGIGGLDLAAEWAGFTTVAFCEIDPFCRQVLAKHWPGVPIHENIRSIDPALYRGRIRLLSGGFPCQPYSQAGKRRGEKDDRALWPEMLRVIQGVRPNWIVGENVAGFVSLGLDDLLSDLEEEGYETQAFLVPACGVGALHRRERVFVVANAKGDGRPKRGIGGSLEGEEENERNLDRGGIVSDVSNTFRQGESQQGRIVAKSGGRVGDCGESTPSDTSRELLDWAGQPRQIGREKPTNSRTGDAPYPNGHSPRWSSEPWGQSCRWQSEPDVGRVAHGIPRRVDRLRALGNAVVPQQAYPIFEAIAQIIRSGQC